MEPSRAANQFFFNASLKAIDVSVPAPSRAPNLFFSNQRIAAIDPSERQVQSSKSMIFLIEALRKLSSLSLHPSELQFNDFLDDFLNGSLKAIDQSEPEPSRDRNQ